MNQAELLQFAADLLERFEIPYAVVGSWASGAWGEPRMTRDIDIVIQLDPTIVEEFCEAFPEEDFYVSVSAAKDAARRCSPFNVIYNRESMKLDFMVVPRTGWAQRQLSRRRQVATPTGGTCYMASPEDVILGKLLYFKEGQSDKHLRDIAGIVKASSTPLDYEYLAQSTRELGVGDEWQLALRRAGRT